MNNDYGYNPQTVKNIYKPKTKKIYTAVTIGSNWQN